MLGGKWMICNDVCSHNVLSRNYVRIILLRFRGVQSVPVVGYLSRSDLSSYLFLTSTYCSDLRTGQRPITVATAPVVPVSQPSGNTPSPIQEPETVSGRESYGSSHTFGQ